LTSSRFICRAWCAWWTRTTTWWRWRAWWRRWWWTRWRRWRTWWHSIRVLSLRNV